MGSSIRAVFFDSGHTLVRPVGGRWFPGVRFFELCEHFGHAVPDDADLERAGEVGYAYLDAHHFDVSDEETERLQFLEYYRVVFGALGRPVSEELVERLAQSAVADLNFEPYQGTKAVLDQLAARNIRMALLTDGWPSTRSKYAALGLLDYFSAFVISAEQKCLKPDFGMFRPALDALRVAPQQVLFIDDAPDLVAAALGHGFHAVVIDHAGDHLGHSNRITRLEDILEHIA